MQRLLDPARWDADVLRDALLRLVAALVAVADGVLVVDLCRSRNYADTVGGGGGNGGGEVGFSPAPSAKWSA